MNVKNQKNTIAKLLKVGKKRIHFNPDKLSDIKEAITKTDLRSLIVSKTIKIKQIKGQSKARSRKLAQQKRKGKRKGRGSQKGKKTARMPGKKQWMLKVRSQRKFIKKLRDSKKISPTTYRAVYIGVKNNRFRTIRLIKLHLEENKLFNKNDVQKKA